MKSRLRKAVLAVLIIQVLLFGASILGGSTLKSLSGEYFNILENRVLLRKNYIQDEMLAYLSNLTDFERVVKEQTKQTGVLEDPTLIPQLLEEVLDETIFTLRKSGATEIFIVLEGEEDHEGIYLRDLDPSFNPIDNSDLLIERGSVELARKTGAALDSQWANKFKVEEGDQASQFYDKPYEAAKTYKNLEPEDLAYWSRPFRLSPDDIEIITYSMPLIDESGNPYGVIGVGLTVDFLRSKLKYEELLENRQGAYLLSIDIEKENSFEEVTASGIMYNTLVGTETTLTKSKTYENIYKVEGKGKVEGNVYASKQYLSLYNTNTPFEKDKWSLTGFVEEKTLFMPIETIITSFMISLVASLIFGIMMTYVVGTWFMEPINRLMKKVQRSSPDDPFRLIKTKILEIDELGLAIETLNKQVLDSASKLSQIINMVNMPIGAFEYEAGVDQAFCTSTLFDILGIDHDAKSTYVKTSLLKNIMAELMKNPEKDLSHTYRHYKNDGGTCYVRLTMEEQEGKVLGVIEDVTDEILTKQKIEYERDHDVLTHLYNRRAFEVLCRDKMKDGIGDFAAFVMWDLDNLKYINDTYGHEYGDRYIKEAASVLNSFADDRTIVARMSGDEFYIFIFNYSEQEEIRKKIQDIKEDLFDTFLQVPDGEIIRIRASAGVAWYPHDSTNYDELIKYSDFAMYEIKNKEKGNVAEFCMETYNKDSILLYGKEELNQFIDQSLVEYAFQPIIDVKTSEVFAYEALMRPQTRILKTPYDIIRLAQSESKLYEIEKITWFEAMAAYVKKREDFGEAKIFINSIPNHVLSRRDLRLFEEKFENYLDCIVVEITETEQSDGECTKLKQETVAKWGSHVALDDFGSGYSSEISLLALSPKYVKIDMTIVRGIDKDRNRQKLFKNILSYAKNRGIKIIAEGVETKEEMYKLIEFGVDYVQGYYVGRPRMTPQPISIMLKQEIKATQSEE